MSIIGGIASITCPCLTPSGVVSLCSLRSRVSLPLKLLCFTLGVLDGHYNECECLFVIRRPLTGWSPVISPPAWDIMTASSPLISIQCLRHISIHESMASCHSYGTAELLWAIKMELAFISSNFSHINCIYYNPPCSPRWYHSECIRRDMDPLLGLKVIYHKEEPLLFRLPQPISSYRLWKCWLVFWIHGTIYMAVERWYFQ